MNDDKKTAKTICKNCGNEEAAHCGEFGEQFCPQFFEPSTALGERTKSEVDSLKEALNEKDYDCDAEDVPREQLTEVYTLAYKLEKERDEKKNTEAKLREALRMALDWIDAVPKETILPTMPGFDRDEVEALLISRTSRAAEGVSGMDLTCEYAETVHAPPCPAAAEVRRLSALQPREWTADMIHDAPEGKYFFLMPGFRWSTRFKNKNEIKVDSITRRDFARWKFYGPVPFPEDN